MTRRLALAVALLATGGGAVLLAWRLLPPGPARRVVAPQDFAIVVDPGPFPDVPTAAGAERTVDWLDADPRDDDACTTCFAAMELRAGLARALGVAPDRIPFLRPGAAPTADGVLILETGSARGAAGDAFTLEARTRGRRWRCRIAGAGRAGTLYGTYAWLERLGYRFLGPDAGATVAPRGLPPLPARLDDAESPGFEARGFWAWEPRADRPFLLWMARNRMNLWTLQPADAAFLHKLAIRQTVGGHDLQSRFLAPGSGGRPAAVAAHFRAHPDWYGLVDGRRRAGPVDGAQVNFCTSNRRASASFAHELREAFVAGDWRDADELALWMADNGRWCECAACRALGSPTQRLLRLSAEVADSLADLPGRAGPVEVSTLAFLETLAPPPAGASGARLPPNLCVYVFPLDRCYEHPIGAGACPRTNGIFQRIFEAWSTALPPAPARLGVGEYYGIGEQRNLPVVLTHVIAQDVAWYAAHGYRRFHTMHAPTRLWGPWEWTHRLLAASLWTPGVDADSLRADYARHAFPGGEREAVALLDDLEAASRDVKFLKHRVVVGSAIFDLRRQLAAGAAPTPIPHLGWVDGPEPECPALTRMRDAAHRAQVRLARLRAAARDSTARLRLDRYDAGVGYLADTLDFFAAFLALSWDDRHHRAGAARAEAARLAPIARRLAAVRDLVRVSSAHANADDGLEATGYAVEYRDLQRRYGAP